MKDCPVRRFSCLAHRRLSGRVSAALAVGAASQLPVPLGESVKWDGDRCSGTHCVNGSSNQLLLVPRHSTTRVPGGGRTMSASPWRISQSRPC
jgi:hypothetical protein